MHITQLIACLAKNNGQSTVSQSVSETYLMSRVPLLYLGARSIRGFAYDLPCSTSQSLILPQRDAGDPLHEAMAPERTEVVDNEGDVTLVVGPEGKKRFRVSSHMLERGSSVFKAMFSDRFAEGAQQRRVNIHYDCS